MRFRYCMRCPSNQVHPLAEQALRKYTVSPCTFIYCYSILCHSEQRAQLILLLLLIFGKHFLSFTASFSFIKKKRQQKHLAADVLEICIISCSIYYMIIHYDTYENDLNHFLPMRSRRSMATVSKALLIMGYSSSTSLKWSTDRE